MRPPQPLISQLKPLKYPLPHPQQPSNKPQNPFSRETNPHNKKPPTRPRLWATDAPHAALPNSSSSACSLRIPARKVRRPRISQRRILAPLALPPPRASCLPEHPRRRTSVGTRAPTIRAAVASAFATKFTRGAIARRIRPAGLRGGSRAIAFRRSAASDRGGRSEFICWAAASAVELRLS